MKTDRSITMTITLIAVSVFTAESLPAQNHTHIVRMTPGQAGMRALPGKPFDVHFIAAHKEKGPVTFLGVNAAPVDPSLSAQLNLPEGMGLTVRFVAPESPADKAGLREHDVLRMLDDQILIHPFQLKVLIRSRQAEDAVVFTVLRGGKEQKLKVVLEEREQPIHPGMESQGHWFTHPAMPMPHGSTSNSSSSSHSSSQSQSHNMETLAPEAIALAHGNGDYYLRNREQVRKYVFDPSTEYISSFEDARLGRHTVISMKDRNLVLNDDEGTLIVKSADEGRFIIALDKDGEEIFKGTIETGEDRNNLPESVRKRLEKLENTHPRALEFEQEIEPGEFDILLRRNPAGPETI